MSRKFKIAAVIAGGVVGYLIAEGFVGKIDAGKSDVWGRRLRRWSK